MSKKIHLICNAHLDPVWQWEWEEGAAETLSTFQIAADFCEEFDHFVFCHNEAILYQWIEEYAPALFAQIQSLVKQKKWHIMGGWHLQPDCNMPSGEGFVRQILSGRKYFKEKFNVEPTVAVNLDPFGHSRGLVQIMTKCGYDGYLFMRPGGEQFIQLQSNEFTWVGYDGSEITAVRIPSGYNSQKGQASKKVLEHIEMCPEDDFFLCLWGIGNHGGGPSRKDLEDLETLQQEVAPKGIELIHSTPEEYIAKVRENHTLPREERSLNPWAPGCYTSQVRIKQRYRQAENIYFMTEIMCSHAHSQGLMQYPEKELAGAMYDIMTVQFHDILPGSSIQPAEEMGLRMLDHALEILSRIKARAFFALSSGQKKADTDKIPVFAYNPYPYPVSGDFQTEFMLWDQNWNPEFMMPDLYDEDGNHCPSQCEKEYSTIPLEWRKRVTFHATLKPMSLNRFDCGFIAIPSKPVPDLEKDDTHFHYRTGNRWITINRETGLVDKIEIDGTNYTAPNAFALEVYQDNFDPWYMEKTAWKEKIGEFRLLNREEASEFCCTDSPIDAVRVVEDGDVRTIVEAVFGYRTSRAVVKYILSHAEGLQTDIRIVWNEKQKLVKLNIPAAFQTEHCIGEQAYGQEILKNSMEENVSQKYIVMQNVEKDSGILVMNNGVYGSSFDEQNSSLKITLLRSPSYCAHPLDGRVTMPQNRYMPYIEQGERDFSFRLCFGSCQKLLNKAARDAQEFNMQPMMLSFYPTGLGNLPACPLQLCDTEIIQLTTFKKAECGDGYLVRLFNPTSEEQTAQILFGNQMRKLSFHKYEIKTICCSNEDIFETDLCI